MVEVVGGVYDAETLEAAHWCGVRGLLGLRTDKTDPTLGLE